MYIENLKVYTRDDEQMERCKTMIQEFSRDIKMEFGLEKCAVIHMKQKKIVDSPIVDDIPVMTAEDTYNTLELYKPTKSYMKKRKKKQRKNILEELEQY